MIANSLNSVAASSAECKSRRPAFSLVELVVSVGILVLMLAVAGQVMSLTVGSTGQAKAITEINQQLRIFERMIRDDLRQVDRANSLMVIKCNPINAYWTQAGKDADNNADPSDGYPHTVDPERTDPFVLTSLVRPRADVLMFFTQRVAKSSVHPDVSTTVQQVVYGHADLGNYAAPTTPGGPFTFELGPNAFPNDPDEASPIPAEKWLLARRNVLLSPHTPSSPAAYLMPPNPPTSLDDDLILRGVTDVIEDFVYETLVLRPVSDDVDGAGFPRFLPKIFQDSAGNTFPSGITATPYERSLLDSTPPPTLAFGVNNHLLSHCASFKVEWALDPRSTFVGGRLDNLNRVLWIDQGVLADPAKPTDPVKPLQPFEDVIADLEAAGHGDKATLVNNLVHNTLGGNGEYSLFQRFGDGSDAAWVEDSPWVYPSSGEGRANVATFTARRLDASGLEVPEEIFPAALRITVDVFDPLGRLDRPIRHVIITPVGR